MSALAAVLCLLVTAAALMRVRRPRRGAYRFIVALRPLVPLPTAQDNRP